MSSETSHGNRHRVTPPTPRARRVIHLFQAWCEACSWERAVDAALSPWKLGHSRYMLLDTAEYLDRLGAFSQRTLVEVTHLAESGICRGVQSLALRGLIGLDIDATGREWRLRVTDSGRALLAQVRPVIEALAEEFVKTPFPPRARIHGRRK